MKYILYLFITVKGHELDGSIRKYPDHHCPITLVQTKKAFFLWNSSKSGKHSCKERAAVSLMWQKHGKNHFPFLSMFYPDVYNGGSGPEEES